MDKEKTPIYAKLSNIIKGIHGYENLLLKEKTIVIFLTENTAEEPARISYIGCGNIADMLYSTAAILKNIREQAETMNADMDLFTKLLYSALEDTVGDLIFEDYGND